MTEQVEESNGLFTLAQAQEVRTVVESGRVPSSETSENDTQEAVDNSATPYQKTDYKKRYDDLKRHYDMKLNEHKQEVESIKAQLNANRPQYTPPKSVEELESFRKENPDLYNVVESVAHLNADRQLKEVQKRISELEKEKRLALRDVEMNKLRKAHPDVDDIKGSDEFKQWASVQPREVQSWLFHQVDSRLAARALDLFKSDHRSSVNKQQASDTPAAKRNDAAAPVKTQGSVDMGESGEAPISVESLKKMSLEEYEKNREAIYKQIGLKAR
jgi:hypothetical protein